MESAAQKPGYSKKELGALLQGGDKGTFADIFNMSAKEYAAHTTKTLEIVANNYRVGKAGNAALEKALEHKWVADSILEAKEDQKNYRKTSISGIINDKSALKAAKLITKKEGINADFHENFVELSNW